MIVIIDYGMGNVKSVEKALNFLNIKTIISDKKKDINNSTGLILPGVGSFEQGMMNLKQKNLIKILNNEILIKKKPFLGICLGMQLIMEVGYEPKKTKGLGWIKGEVVPIKNKRLPIPHLGWNNVYSKNEKNLDNIHNNFYFIHSYHVIINEKIDKKFVEYEYEMVASFCKENIFATQFHPEKSQLAGLKLIQDFFNKANVKA